MEQQNESKVGDVTVKGGIKTTVTDIDPNTGAISWDVEYAADYLQLYQQVQQLFKSVEKASRQSNAEPFIKDWGQDVRQLRNSLRTYLRNNKFDEYQRVKNMNEMSTTGGSANFSSNTGTGAQYATPNAFKKKKKVEESNPGATLGPGPKATENGVKDNAYVKQYKYRLVNKDQLNKQAKGIEVKHLWNK
jgi:hypothetical protein